MKKKIYIFIFILFVIFISLYATNPTKSEFKEYAQEYVEESVMESGVTSNSFLDNVLALFSGKAASAIADIAYTRNNYHIFSTYEIKGIDIEYRFLGIFRQFIPLKNNVDSSNINKKFKDAIVLNEDTVELEEDYYKAYPIQLEKQSKLTIDVKYVGGPSFEMILLEEQDFKNFENGNDDDVMVHDGWLQVINKDLKKDFVLNANKKYYLVFDNTDIGAMVPPMNMVNDICYFEVKLSMKELTE